MPDPAPEVYAIYGVEPELTAYALARYSRSALSLRESIREMDGQRAEKFLNTFYFQYGHRSIADLAHVGLALERLSILAAIEVADEPRWDGQERSTRYQNFQSSGCCVPGELGEEAAAGYRNLTGALLAAYERVGSAVARHLTELHPRPAEMRPEAYQRTVRARAFDNSRYLLPLGTATSLGQIVSARTLEGQIGRLLASPYAECRALGEALRAAATTAAFDPRAAAKAEIAQLVQAAAAQGRASEQAAAGAAFLAEPVRCAPTLVKYTEPHAWRRRAAVEMRQAAAELLAFPPTSEAGVDLVAAPPLEVELAAALLYPHCHHAWRQVIAAVEALPAPRREEIVALDLGARGAHDELRREYQVGLPFQFDLLIDLGAFRDLHRHRRCTQLLQPYTARHGFETPEPVVAAGGAADYTAAMRGAGDWVEANAATPLAAAYGLPLGYRHRSLFKMDYAELAYIAELRTAAAGHFSYRAIAWKMFEALRGAHPTLAARLRVTDPTGVNDPLQR